MSRNFYQTNLDANMKILSKEELKEKDLLFIDSDLFNDYTDSVYEVKKIDGFNIFLKPKKNKSESDINHFVNHIRKVKEDDDGVFYVSTWLDYLRGKRGALDLCDTLAYASKTFSEWELPN